MSIERLTRKHHKLVTDNSVAAVYDGPCIIGDLTVSNPNSSEVWIQIFDKAAADVTLGTTTPGLSYPCSVGDGSSPATSVVVGTDSKLQMENGFQYAITTTRTGSTAPSLDVVVNGQWRKG